MNDSFSGRCGYAFHADQLAAGPLAPFVFGIYPLHKRLFWPNEGKGTQSLTFFTLGILFLDWLSLDFDGVQQTLFGGIGWDTLKIDMLAVVEARGDGEST